MKKRTLAFLLIFALLASSASAFAASTSSFDKSVFQNSRKFSRTDSGGWCLAGCYQQNYSDAYIIISALLFDSYVSKGWGPELRFEFIDKGTSTYNIVTSFRAEVDSMVFDFKDISEGDDCSYVFGGKVMKQFLSSIDGAKEVSFFYSYDDVFGNSYTGSDTHIRTGRLTELIEMGRYFKQSNAWSVVADLAENDTEYGATMYKAG